MKQVTVRLIPSKSGNPIITRTTSDPQLILEDTAHDTYTLEITSAVYKPYSTTVVVDGETTVNIHLEALVTQSIEWRPKSTVTTIPVTTTYIEDSTLNQGVEIEVNAGVPGKTTETWEAEYVDGVATGNTRNRNVSTVNMIPRQVRRGTKVPEVELEDILTANNLEAGGATNIYVNGERTQGDVIPTGGQAFELVQFDPPAGAFLVRDGNLQANKQYTLAFSMENTGESSIQQAHFVIGMSYYGGTHYFNGVEKSVDPNAGQYPFLTHISNTGKYQYHYQFWTEPGTPEGDYFQVNFDNVARNTRVTISDLAIYEGHVDPYS